MKRVRSIAHSAFVALVLSSAGAAGARAAAPSSGGNEPLGTKTCATCHEESVAAFAHNPHSALDTKGLAAKAGASFSCAACHGDARAHVEKEGGGGPILAFDEKTLASAQTERCLKCHGNAHPRFRQGPHGKAGMSCVDCHSVHAASAESASLLKPAPVGRLVVQQRGTSASCAACHGDIANRFQLNAHHRLQEGVVECTSCHDPHAPDTRTLLGGYKQAACEKCHADKGGPFVYEHGSVRVEGCVGCHDPHGSVNRHQLTYQKEGALCLSCHNAIPGFHSRFGLDTNCTNCHTSIHGSNLDPFFLQ